MATKKENEENGDSSPAECQEVGDAFVERNNNDNRNDDNDGKNQHDDGEIENHHDDCEHQEDEGEEVEEEGENNDEEDEENEENDEENEENEEDEEDEEDIESYSSWNTEGNEFESVVRTWNKMLDSSSSTSDPRELNLWTVTLDRACAEFLVQAVSKLPPTERIVIIDFYDIRIKQGDHHHDDDDNTDAEEMAVARLMAQFLQLNAPTLQEIEFGSGPHTLVGGRQHHHPLRPHTLQIWIEALYDMPKLHQVAFRSCEMFGAPLGQSLESLLLLTRPPPPPSTGEGNDNDAQQNDDDNDCAASGLCDLRFLRCDLDARFLTKVMQGVQNGPGLQVFVLSACQVEESRHLIGLNHDDDDDDDDDDDSNNVVNGELVNLNNNNNNNNCSVLERVVVPGLLRMKHVHCLEAVDLSSSGNRLTANSLPLLSRLLDKAQRLDYLNVSNNRFLFGLSAATTPWLPPQNNNNPNNNHHHNSVSRTRQRRRRRLLQDLQQQQPFWEAVQRHAALNRLNLDGCGIDNYAAKALLTALERPCSLKQLELWSNPMTIVLDFNDDNNKEKKDQQQDAEDWVSCLPRLATLRRLFLPQGLVAPSNNNNNNNGNGGGGGGLFTPPTAAAIESILLQHAAGAQQHQHHQQNHNNDDDDDDDNEVLLLNGTNTTLLLPPESRATLRLYQAIRQNMSLFHLAIYSDTPTHLEAFLKRNRLCALLQESLSTRQQQQQVSPVSSSGSNNNNTNDKKTTTRKKMSLAEHPALWPRALHVLGGSNHSGGGSSKRRSTRCGRRQSRGRERTENNNNHADDDNDDYYHHQHSNNNEQEENDTVVVLQPTPVHAFVREFGPTLMASLFLSSS